jgi:hypothetical protein
MSYALVDVTEESAEPALLVALINGAQAWYYCSGTDDVAYSGHTYVHSPMIVGEINNTCEIPKDTLELKFPTINPFAAALLAYVPDTLTTVTVRRKHYSDAEALVVWKGRVLNYTASLGEVTVQCEPIFSSLQRIGLRTCYQRSCTRVLGEAGCNVVRATYSAQYTVIALDGITVTFSANLTENYLGGLLLAEDGTQRTIVGVGANTVTLMRAVQSLATSLAAHPTGFAVTLYQGCDRSTAMCSSRFNNIGNFRGFPGIQWINPMTSVNGVFQ